MGKVRTIAERKKALNEKLEELNLREQKDALTKKLREMRSKRK